MDFIDRLKYIKIEDEEGNLSENVPIGADAENVDFDENQNIKQKINSVESSMRRKDTKIEMSDLSQEIKEAMTGGAVPIVGDDSVYSSSIVEKSIYPKHLSFVNIKTNNLIDRTKIKKYRYVDYDDSGKEKDSKNYMVTDYCDVGVYEINKTRLKSNNTNGLICFYDDNKEYIGTIPNETSNFLLSYENIKYFRLNILMTQALVNEFNIYMIKDSQSNYEDSQLNTYDHATSNFIRIPTENLIGNNINPENCSFIEHITNNLFNKNLADRNGYFTNAGIYYSNLIRNTNTYGCMLMNLPNYIKDETIFYQNNGTGYVVFFDDNMNYIGSLDSPNSSSFTIPFDNCKYVAKSLLLTEFDSYYLICGESDLVDYYVLNNNIKINDIELKNSNILYGKKIGFLGDSITYGVGASNPYPSLIQEKNSCTCINYGISGNSLAKAGSNGQPNAQERPMCIRYTEMDDDLDYIVVFGGSNDYAYNIALGETDSVNVEEFNGALNVLITGLIKKYPGKPILFLTPLYRGTSPTNEKLLSYRDAIIERCEYYSIPVFNLTDRSTIKATFDNLNELYYNQGDRLHPNNEGHKILARIIENQLKSI